MPHRNPPGRSANSKRSVKWPTVSAVVFLVVVSVVFWKNPEFARASIPTITGTGWWWVALGTLGVMASYLCQAAVLIGLMPRKVPWLPATMAQVAAAASKVVAPAASGVFGLNARFAVKNGMSVTSGLTTVAATQIAQVGMTVLLVLIFAPIAGVSLNFSVPGSAMIWVGVVIALCAVGMLWYLRTRKLPEPEPGELTGLQRFVMTSRFILNTIRNPRRLALTVGGSFLLTTVLAVCMWAMVHAVGGEIGFLKAAVIMMAGSALGSVFPTPGGVGGVEASMTALFLAAGTPYDVSLQAVLMFRLLSFWLPAPLGTVAAVWLRRHNHL